MGAGQAVGRIAARWMLLLAAALASLWTSSASAEAVGYAETRLVDPISGQGTSAMIWYPTAGSQDETVTRGPYRMQATENAPIAPGKFPLLLLSHGSGGSPLDLRDLGLAFAAHGYVVAGALQVGDNYENHKGAGTTQVLRGRPKTVSALIDTLTADPRFAASIDATRIGATGFSAGGYTVLALAGATPTLAAARAHCRDMKADAFCHRYAHYKPRGNASLAGLGDPRIRAIAALAPVTVWFDANAFTRLRVPVRLYAGDQDDVASAEWNARRISRLIPRAELTDIQNAGHYSFVAPVPTELRAEFGEIAYDPPGFDRAAFRPQLVGELIGFFDRSLSVPR